MKQNNCLVLNNSLHLYPSSLRRRAELTLGSVRKGKKAFRHGESWGEQQEPSLCPLCPGSPGCLALPQAHVGCSWCPAGPSCPSLRVLLPGVIPPQGKLYSLPMSLSGIPAGPFLQVPQNGAPTTQSIKRSSQFHISCILGGALCAISCSVMKMSNSADPRTDLCVPHQSLVSSPSPV